MNENSSNVNFNVRNVNSTGNAENNNNLWNVNSSGANNNNPSYAVRPVVRVAFVASVHRGYVDQGRIRDNTETDYCPLTSYRYKVK